jgi:UDP-N-acetylglucosamine 4-epimerase
VDYVQHQAALGSVPRSIDDPIRTNQSDVDGLLNMLVAARDNKVKRVVYAASSSTCSEHPGLIKVEEHIGKPLSPYAVTKYVNELYAGFFDRTYDFHSIGLRYFNICGKRQDPEGAYAAVIPRWLGEMLEGKTPLINGDGKISRDFSYIDNALQANILATTTQGAEAVNGVCNISFGKRNSPNELFNMIRQELAILDGAVLDLQAYHGPERIGDVRRSLADISRAKDSLG